MTEHIHMALSVDIDRFSDAHLRREFCSWIEFDGKRITDPRELRILCSKARGQGLVVFPPCHHTHADGTCAHHATGPGRVQRKRQKGRRLPEGAVCVSRPSRWGNPYRLERRDDWFDGTVSLVVDSRDGTVIDYGAKEFVANLAVEEYRRALLAGELRVTVEDVRRELRGKLLACWCKPGAPCHADVLLEVANGGAA